MLVGIEFWKGEKLISVRRDQLKPEDDSERVPFISRGKGYAAPWGLQEGHPLTVKWPGRHCTLPLGWTVARKTVQGFDWANYSPAPVRILAASFVTKGKDGRDYRTCLRPGEFIQAAHIELGIADRLYIVVVPPPKGLEHTAIEWPRIVGHPITQ